MTTHDVLCLDDQHTIDQEVESSFACRQITLPSHSFPSSSFLTSSGPQPPTSKHKSQCPFPECTGRSKHLKSHFLRKHVPWYVGQLTACANCQSQEGREYFEKAKHTACDSPESLDKETWVHLINGLLLFLTQKLGLASFQELLDLVNEKGVFINLLVFNPQEVALLRHYESINGLYPTADFRRQPFVSAASLLHWRVLSSIILDLTKEEQDQVTSHRTAAFYDVNGGIVPSTLPLPPADFGSGSPDGATPSIEVIEEPPLQCEYIDSHFHLDTLISRRHIRNFQDADLELESESPHLQYAIANYVYPDHWPYMDAQVQCSDKLRVTCGVHPRLAGLSGTTISELERGLAHPRCVGLGEVGLDYTCGCECAQPCSSRIPCGTVALRQVGYLLRALPLLERYDLTLVVHCRDHGDGSAAHDFLDLLVALDLTHLRVHRHCFAGTGHEVREWMSTLPNLCFGITPLLMRKRALQAVVRDIGLRHLLLESDAPYFAPRGRFNTPWDLPLVAQRIADLKSCPVGDVYAATTANARWLYVLP